MKILEDDGVDVEVGKFEIEEQQRKLNQGVEEELRIMGKLR